MRKMLQTLQKRIFLYSIVFFLIAGLLVSYAGTNPNVLNVSAATQAIYYVDPANGNDSNNGLSESTAFQTIPRARDSVRLINSNMTGDIYVYLRGGKYALSDKVTFTAADSGTNGYNVIYAAYPGETPVITGEYRVTGWTLYDSAKNIYKANVGSREFRQLYVNENRAIRARYPNLTDAVTGGPYFEILNAPFTSGGATQPIIEPYTISASQIGSWANDASVEFYWLSHWSHNMGHLAGYSINGNTATVDISEVNWGYSHHWQANPYFYWENSYSFLDAQGEWYLDKTSDSLYYIPRAGENMSTVEVIVPTLETLFEVTGSVENLALNKTVESSGYVAGGEPSNAIDGLTSTRWYSQNSGDKWLKIDLGASYTINRYLVKHASKSADNFSLDTKSYKLQTSMDGMNWTDTDIVSNATEDAVLRQAEPEVGRVGNFTARYVRLYITQATQNGAPDQYARIQEIQLLAYTFAHNIQFKGLDFRYSNWTAPDANGYSSGQAGYVVENSDVPKYYNHSEAWEAVPAMVNFMYTKNILFEGNKVKYAGGIGIKTMFESESNIIRGNLVDTCSGGGIYVGCGEHWYDGRTFASSRLDLISNNYITDIGLDYKDSVGIFSPFPQYLTVEYNELQNMPYSGISVGWAWDDKDLYGMTNLEIKYNRIHNIMRVLDDGGGIYTLGRIPNTLIHHNYIFNLPVSQYQGFAVFGSANGGLYLDNGSSYKTVQYNVVNNGGIAMYASNLPLHDNMFQYNYYNSVFVPKVQNLGTSYNYNNLEQNNVKISGQSWPQAALDIMNAANIQASYRGIIPSDNEQSIGSTFESSFLNCFDGNYLATGEYITSSSRNCWATLLANGNFVLYDGAPGSTSTKIWETATIDTNTTYSGKHFVTISNSGYLNVFRGTAPWNNQGLFRRFYVGRDISGYTQNGLFVTVTDNKNIEFYSGKTPYASKKIQCDRTWLQAEEYLREGQYISSANRNGHLVLKSNGNLCLYTGSDPEHQGSLIWQSGSSSSTGNYFLFMQSDGNLCIYRGTGPENNQGLLWQSYSNSTTGDYFLILQDDLNLCIYRGTGPGNNQGFHWMR